MKEIDGVFLRGALSLYYNGNVVTIECEKSELFTIVEYIERTRNVKVRIIAA